MTKETADPKPIDNWQGIVEWVEEDQGVFISDLYFPSEADAIDHVEEVEIPITSLAKEQRAMLDRFLHFSCTVELGETSVSGIKEVRDITFLPPVPITSGMVAKAMEEFAFLSDLSDKD